MKTIIPLILSLAPVDQAQTEPKGAVEFSRARKYVVLLITGNLAGGLVYHR